MEQKLTWKQKTVIRILLYVAKICATDKEMVDELQTIANHISTSAYIN